MVNSGSTFFMGKPTTSMVIFNSYGKLPSKQGDIQRKYTFMQTHMCIDLNRNNHVNDTDEYDHAYEMLLPGNTTPKTDVKNSPQT